MTDKVRPATDAELAEERAEKAERERDELRGMLQRIRKYGLASENPAQGVALRFWRLL